MVATVPAGTVPGLSNPLEVAASPKAKTAYTANNGDNTVSVLVS